MQIGGLDSLDKIDRCSISVPKLEREHSYEPLLIDRNRWTLRSTDAGVSDAMEFCKEILGWKRRIVEYPFGVSYFFFPFSRYQILDNKAK